MDTHKPMLEADTRTVADIVKQCIQAGDSPSNWRLHLARLISGFIDADVTMVGEIIGIRAGSPEIGGMVDAGWDERFRRESWMNALEHLKVQPDYHIAFNAFGQKLQIQDSVTVTRRMLVNDEDWYHSFAYREFHAKGGTDAMLYSGCVIEQKPDRIHFICCNRATGREQFDERERQILQMANEELTPRIGGALCGFWEPSVDKLSMELRVLLDNLLDGKTEEEIATNLNVPQEDLNDSVYELCGALNVESQRDLIDSWTRRGWAHDHS